MMHQESSLPCLPPGSTALDGLNDACADNIVLDSLKATHLLPICTMENNAKPQTISAHNSSGETKSDFRRLASRLGSQGSLLYVSESDDDLDCSQDSLGEVEMMIRQVSVENLAGHAHFLSPSSPPKSKMSCDVSSAMTKHVAGNSVVVPRSKTPGLMTSCGDLGTKLNPVTPTKPASENIDPLTPNANLKMLSSVASPEIRNREKLKAIMYNDADVLSVKEEEVATSGSPVETGEETDPKLVICHDSVNRTADDQDVNLDDDVISQHISRKEKSLGLLCQRFLARYPEYPGLFDTIEICLDEVAKDLNVERRRIYDIVNVLESVEIVSRMAKNKYVWHGKNNLSHTLSKLKALAIAEGFAEQIERIKDYEVTRELDGGGGGGGGVHRGRKMKKICSVSYLPSSVISPRRKEPLRCSDQANIQDTPYPLDNIRKEKSLGIMSQKFLMLFLVSQPKTVNLDISAKILIGNPNVDRTENGKFKTKIRRLYDIANILTSLDLIRKVHVTEVRGRKPAFKYVGPTVDDIKEEEACSHDGNHRPSSKHSLLDCIQNPQVCSISNYQQCFKPISRHSLLNQPILDFGASERHGQHRMTSHSAMSKFSRHASFEQICEVAEQERNRLYFESRSQPSSPTTKRQLLMPRFHSANWGSCVSSSALPSGASNLKHLMVIRGGMKVNEAANAGEGVSGVSEEEDMRCTLVQKYPIQTMTLTHIGQMPSLKPDEAIAEPEPQTLMKAQLSQPDATRQPTIVTLTKDQLDAVIRSLSSSIGGATDTEDPDSAGSKYVDASTQSSPQIPSGIASLIKKLDDEPKGRLPGVAMLLQAGGEVGVQTVQLPPALEHNPCVQIIRLDCGSAETNGNNKRAMSSTDADWQEKRQRTEEYKSMAVHNAVLETPEPRVPVASSSNTQDAEVADITRMAVTSKSVTKLEPSPPKAIQVDSGFLDEASPLTNHSGYQLPSTPKVTLIGYDLSPPLLHGFNDVISPVSQLNTPPMDYILQQPLDENSMPGGQPFLFQFPALSTSGAAMHSSLAVPQRSQPNTPTFRLSSTSSPVMLLQSRHKESLSEEVRRLTAPQQQQYMPLHPPPTTRTLLGKGLPNNLSFGGLSGVSPSAKISPHCSMNTTSGHTPKVSPANILPNGGFVSTGSRQSGGYTPTSGNIINLVPLFSSSPQATNLKVVNPPASQMHAGMTQHLQKPVAVSLQSSYSLLSQTDSSIAKADYMMRTPQLQMFSQELMSPSQSMRTPTSSTAGKVIATPNAFFRGTPGGVVPAAAAYSQHVLINQNSAFQSVSPFQTAGGGGLSTARRLAMTHYDFHP